MTVLQLRNSLWDDGHSDFAGRLSDTELKLRLMRVKAQFLTQLLRVIGDEEQKDVSATDAFLSGGGDKNQNFDISEFEEEEEEESYVMAMQP
ncbi:unnamed protein product [Polarella glacialis]|uniref:Uncharacterized protein n=1 Tax=Polarella glacialis TaxID=89957 RepID=A0A813HHT3_POLGL|nr:unnamed protein product [Polarella glacialis]